MLQNNLTTKTKEQANLREDYLKIKRIGNGFIVTSLNEPPCAYPYLGRIEPLEGDVPMCVGEHIYNFFNKDIEDGTD